MRHVDTETLGLTGPIILIQYAHDDGPTTLYNVWEKPVKETLHLIERICDDDVCAFNLSFDWFHLTKLYNLFRGVQVCSRTPQAEEIARLSESARTDDKLRRWCLKPKRALDLFLITRQGKWQCLMDRKPITIRRVPAAIAFPLAKILTDEIKFSDIFFARRSAGYEWKVKFDDDPDFPDIQCTFAASGGLKPICSEIFHTKFSDLPIPKELHPEEYSYDPYCTKWLKVFYAQRVFWERSKNARSYAEQDINLLQRLFHHLGCPTPGDTNSELACAVGAARWRGFSVNLDRTRELIESEIKYRDAAPTAPNEARRWVSSAQGADDIPIQSTNKRVLERLEKLDNETGRRARAVTRARQAEKQLTILTRLRDTKRFNPDFKVIGAKSGRMSGGSDLGAEGGSINPQGIQRSKEFRSIFSLRDETDILSGGDFDSFEVTIADAAYNDNNLRRDLLSGKSLHAIFGALLYDDTYENILTTKGSKHSKYNTAKSSVFSLIYGAQIRKLAETAGVAEDKAELSYKDFVKKYPGIRKARELVFDMLCAISQPAGLGTAVVYTEPADYIESLLGFRRYFTLENQTIRSLYELAQNPPKDVCHIARVIRRNKEQTVQGATQSALYAAAFTIQAQNQRAGANHVIQSTGAEICKELQRRLWDLQPVGVGDWYIQLLNVHDEVLAVHKPELDLTSVVKVVIETYKRIVPLISMKWKTDIKDWSDK